MTIWAEIIRSAILYFSTVFMTVLEVCLSMDLLMTLSNPLMPVGKRLNQFTIIGSILTLGFIVYEYKMIGQQDSTSIFSLMSENIDYATYVKGVEDYINKYSNVWQTYLIVPIFI
jgi:hypothetical protein